MTTGRKFLSNIAERRRAKRTERQGWRALTAEEAEHIRQTGELPEGARDVFLPRKPADWEPDEVNRRSAP